MSARAKVIGVISARATSHPSSNSRESELAERLAAVRKRLDGAAIAAGRKSSEIELLPITKFFPATDVAILSGLGCRSFGENRDQEAAAKATEVADIVDTPVAWHMVGQIQRNKARSVVRWAYAAHSVGSERVVAALDRAATAALESGDRAEPLRVYVQISLDGAVGPRIGESTSRSQGSITRGGVDIGHPELVDTICGQVDAAGGLMLVGLMAIPPADSDPNEAFAALQAEHRRVLAAHPQATRLSAGMSADLEAAVKHGSTCVRVGTALLGPRPLTSP